MAAAYTPPVGSQLISDGKGNNYYVNTTAGTSTITTTSGSSLATSNDGGKTYTFTSTGTANTNLQLALTNPQSSASKTVQQNAGKTLQNSARSTGTADQQGGSIPTNLQQPRSTSSGILKYPFKIKPDQDRVKFQAVEIQPRPQSSGKGLGFQFPGPTYNKVGGGPVILAIQAPISDQNSVDWGPNTVNAIDAALFKESYDFMKSKNFDQAGQQLSSAMNSIMDLLKSNNDRIQKALAGQAAGINNVLARTDNVVLNPNLELLFQGPQLRPFTFQFKLSARDQPEAEEIKKIIRYFKKNMAVRKDDASGLFLKAPYVFTIQYFKGSEPHKGINTISPSDNTKACALTNCSVDYTPLGSYMTYEDGTMVAYTLSLQFQEITPVYSDDYDKLPENAIGY